MCVIAYKKQGISMPIFTKLKNCFVNNPDGAGYMFPADGKVQIVKGLMSFEAFQKSLNKTIEKYGAERPYVLHFRISTQAGIRKDNTHPFPLSKDMDELRKLRVSSRFGIAHNGIIYLTSSTAPKGKELTHNDTMEFITEYLSLIIKTEDYYRNLDTLDLIEKLCESKLAIMDGTGHCELLGRKWIEDDGILYSNDTFMPALQRQYSTVSTFNSYNYSFEDFSDEYLEYLESFLDEETGLYNFDSVDCPGLDDPDYCGMCLHYPKCFNT